ncbi:flagellar biosynthetic protein FliO [bacterium]|nr:flagellar biosynthetic protein FliO [bacterium]
MKITGSGAWLLVIISLFALTCLLGAAESDADSDKSDKSKSEESGKKSDQKEDDSAAADSKDALPLLAIPPAPVDDEAPTEESAAEGVTASSKKLPPKDKKKNSKSGTIAGKADKARAEEKAEIAISDTSDGEAIDVLVSSNVRQVGNQKKNASGSKPAEKVSSGKSAQKAATEDKAAGTTSKQKPAAGKTPPAGKPAAKTKAAKPASGGKASVKQPLDLSKQPKAAKTKPAPTKAAVKAAPPAAKDEGLAGYFEPEEGIDADSGSTIADLDNAHSYNTAASNAQDAGSEQALNLLDQPVGVINASRSEPSDRQPAKETKLEASAGLIDPLDQVPGGTGEASGSAPAAPRVNYLRTFSVLALLVGCLLLLGRGLKKLQASGRLGGVLPGLGSSAANMKVVESISLGPGKQIMIVQLHGEMLVLGSTPHSINLLDKLPADSQGEGYRSAVSRIIEKELSAPAQPRPRAVNAVNAEPVLTVAEMRRSRGGLSLAEAPAMPGDEPSAAPRWSRSGDGESQLITKIREQLRELEEA